jgi:hypothetical protein
MGLCFSGGPNETAGDAQRYAPCETLGASRGLAAYAKPDKTCGPRVAVSVGEACVVRGGLSWRSSLREEEKAMRNAQPLWGWAGVLLGSIVVLTGCAYDATVQQLSLAEQAEWHLYKNVRSRTWPLRIILRDPSQTVRLICISRSSALESGFWGPLATLLTDRKHTNLDLPHDRHPHPLFTRHEVAATAVPETSALL